MKIKTLHAFFTLPTSSGNSEKIGFSVALEESETPESVVPQLRERAIKIAGRKANQMYEERRELHEQCEKLEQKLNLLRKEWDATADFLKAQGLNPVAPSMPQFRNLLTAVTIESVTVDEEDDEDEDYDEYEDDE